MRFATTTGLMMVLACAGCGANAAAGGGTAAAADVASDTGTNGAETTTSDAADTAVADGASAADTAGATDGKAAQDGVGAADSAAPADGSAGVDSTVGADTQGDSKASGDVGLPPPIPVDNLVTALLSSICKGVTTCPGGQIGSLSFATEAGCLAFFGGSDLATFEEIVASVKAGKTKYDAQQAAICFAEFAGKCGGDDTTESPACTATFTGTVENAGVCTFNEQCKSLQCKKSSLGCPGTCVAKGAVGAGCQSQKECADGLLCVVQKCTSPAAMKVGSSCDGPKQCGQDLFCDLSNASGSCQKLLTKGAQCSGEGCAAGLVCALVGPGVASCLPKIAVGADCSGVVSMSNPQELCVAGNCSGPANGAKTCKLKPGVNGKCDAATPCVDFDLGCVANADGKTGTCKVLPLKGEKCLNVIQFGVSTPACSPLGSCKDGICGGAPVEGEPCAMEGFCAQGFSCGGKGLCKGLPGKGETCFADCKKGFTCQGADETGPGKCVDTVCP